MQGEVSREQGRRRWTAEQIADAIKRHQWYHNIDLGYGIVTPGVGFHPIWDMIRRTRKHVDYRGKKVLDIGSWDGMWAFEAERAGAAAVVATEVQYSAYKTFLLCRDILESNVLPYYNCSVYDLHSRLDGFLFESPSREDVPEDKYFDIAQNFGLLYHLRDPFYGMSQTRSVLKKGGTAIFETAVILDDPAPYMLLNGYMTHAPRVYDDPTTWWAMTIPCFMEMMSSTFFRPIESTMQVIYQMTVDGRKIGRASIAAEAVGDEGVHPDYLGELLIPYRTPGLHLRRQPSPMQDQERREEYQTLRRLKEQSAELKSTIEAIQSSRSWRVTAPLRRLGRLLGREARPLAPPD